MQRLKLWAGLFGGLVIVALAVVSMASAHGGDTNKIHSCVNNNSGTIKIVSPTASCNNGETALDWNQGVSSADLAALQAQIAAAQAQMNAMQQQFAAQLNSVNQQLSGQISALQQQMNSQGGQINNLQQQVSSQGANINNLQGTVSAHSNSIGQLLASDNALKGMLNQWRGVLNGLVNGALQKRTQLSAPSVV